MYVQYMNLQWQMVILFFHLVYEQYVNNWMYIIISDNSKVVAKIFLEGKRVHKSIDILIVTEANKINITLRHRDVNWSRFFVPEN